MSNRIIRILPSFEAAEAARNGLIAQGFNVDDIDVNVTTDEAGPAEGNFYVGDSPAVKGGSDYEDVFKPPVRGDLCMMTVTVCDVSQLERAAVILEYNGGTDVDLVRSAPRSNS